MMVKAELLSLIANGENSGIEFELDDLRPEKLAKEIVALANLQGGHVLLGVDDDGTIVGIKRPDLEHWVMDTVFGRYIHPLITPFYEEVKINEEVKAHKECRVAVITIERGIAKPYVVRYRGREDAYIRIGSTSRRATREQQVRLSAIEGWLHPEQLPVSGSKLKDLNRDCLQEYLSSILGEQILPESENDWHMRLCGLGFMKEGEDGNSLCTIAGLVLFGRSPRRLLPCAGIRWVAFKGDEKDYNYLDDQLIDGPLVALRRHLDGGRMEVVANGMMENVIAAMSPFISRHATVNDSVLMRLRSWQYPVEAVREAIVNAVAHRDWTRNEWVEVACYANRLEVQSPGALHNTMTVEKMLAGQRSPRNTLIASVLRDYGYVEALGMGVRRKIIPLLRQLNGTTPEFIATEDNLRVVMHLGEDTAAT